MLCVVCGTLRTASHVVWFADCCLLIGGICVLWYTCWLQCVGCCVMCDVCCVACRVLSVACRLLVDVGCCVCGMLRAA